MLRKTTMMLLARRFELVGPVPVRVEPVDARPGPRDRYRTCCKMVNRSLGCHIAGTGCLRP